VNEDPNLPKQPLVAGPKKFPEIFSKSPGIPARFFAQNAISIVRQTSPLLRVPAPPRETNPRSARPSQMTNDK